MVEASRVRGGSALCRALPAALRTREPWLRAAFWLALAGLLGVGRLPFVGTDYGLDPDAWRVAAAARTLADEGRYVPSRPPGFPVQEIISSLFVDAGPVGLCSLTALLSIIACLALAGVVWHTTSARGAPRFALAGLTALGFGYTPVVYFNSVVALDYLWAMAFVLLALRAACTGRSVAAGIWLGVAAGCRVTSLASLLPLLLCAGASRPLGERLRGPWPRLVGAAAVSSILFFSPALVRHGLRPWKLAESHADGLRGLLDAPAELLGPFGAAAVLLFGLGGLASRALRGSSPVIEGGRGMGRAALVGVLVYSALYAVYPFELGYLIPAVAFGVLLLARLLPSGAFRAVCAALAVAAFVPRVEWDPHFRVGSAESSPLLQVQLERQRRTQRLTTLVERANALPGRSVVVAGWLEPQFRVMWADLGADNPGVEIVYTIDRARLEHHRAAGHRIYYIPGQQHYNHRVDGVHLSGRGVSPL